VAVHFGKPAGRADVFVRIQVGDPHVVIRQ
jgi:hypothetical protein